MCLLYFFTIVPHQLIDLTIHCVQCESQYVVVANCVLLFFHREQTSEEGGHQLVLLLDSC